MNESFWVCNGAMINERRIRKHRHGSDRGETWVTIPEFWRRNCKKQENVHNGCSSDRGLRSAPPKFKWEALSPRGNSLGLFVRNVRPATVKTTIFTRLVSTVFSLLTTLGKLNTCMAVIYILRGRPIWRTLRSASVCRHKVVRLRCLLGATTSQPNRIIEKTDIRQEKFSVVLGTPYIQRDASGFDWFLGNFLQAWR